ncbi:MAG: cell division protein FtsA [Campylobacterota bacterium]|nr:cell division protein FtsA [Campylobacterota bacterium]
MIRSILAIDIGSTKVCAIMAEIDDNDKINITGTGTVKAFGLKRGNITNIELASKSIKLAVEDAQRISGTEIRNAVVSISGSYAKSLNSSGIVNIQSKEISFSEIDRVMQTSLYNANIPADFEVLHALPYNFRVDEQDFIEDPLGMNASRLEVKTHIITTQKSNIHNLKKAVNKAGIEVDNIVLNGYASSISTLNHDEKELGVVLIDMGANTSNIIIHAGNSIKYNDFLGVGSNHITNDLSKALHTPITIAENIKLNHCSLIEPGSGLMEIPEIGDVEKTKEVSLEIVNTVAFARVEETLMILAEFIKQSGLKNQIGAGIVLTGGFSRMEGIRDLAMATFDSQSVRLARPKDMDGIFKNLKEPEYASAIGLLMYMASSYTKYEIDVNRKVRHPNEIPKKSTTVGKLDVPQPLTDRNPPVIQPAGNTEDSDGREEEEGTKGGLGANNPEKTNLYGRFMTWATQLF